jgi:hypothetical protein
VNTFADPALNHHHPGHRSDAPARERQPGEGPQTPEDPGRAEGKSQPLPHMASGQSSASGHSASG